MPYYGSQWPEYVPVAERRRKAMKKMEQLRKKGMNIQPIEIEGRTIAKTFWGKAWCDHMESLGDFESRLSRGRAYVRNGSVCHLEIKKGRILAMVSGSSLYMIEMKINGLPQVKWNRIKRRCVGQVGSLIELLQGSISAAVMEVVTDRDEGLFPSDAEIQLDCDCPDWAGLCKHLAAVLYGVGARLDEHPELLFLLRGVKHDELIDDRLDLAVTSTTARGGRRRKVNSSDLGAVFGIDLEVKDGNDLQLGKKRSTSARKKNTKKTPEKKSKTSANPKSQKKKKALIEKKKAATKIKGVNKKKTIAKQKPKAVKKAKKSTRKKTKTAKKTTRKKSVSR